ncbi:conserved Plasmodium protein, unknown function [Plasmodium gallinaceum]|uniref:Uncharacterized protein n=1 Tax=Plasmodium gallinaceum TaxID=5849 RepID=A0A1J1GV87_PLAGA|nr:conserved Plasmodium protein, unknown function [Plasmodium gallinaceum]CRG96439.1 conserved Plasmodium protein, unknown function [Plasmodium gallinaceum]
MKNIKQNISNFKELAKQLEACVQSNSTDIDIIRDIYTKCKKDLISLQKLTLEALEKGNAKLFEELVEVSTEVDKSVKLFENYEKNKKEETSKISHNTNNIKFTNETKEDIKKKHRHSKEKRSSKKKDKKYKNVHEESENEIETEKKYKSSSRKIDDIRKRENKSRKKEYEKRKKKKKEKGKEKEKEKSYDLNEDECVEKDINDKYFFQLGSKDSFNKEVETFYNTRSLSSEAVNDIYDSNERKKKKKKKKKYTNNIETESLLDIGNNYIYDNELNSNKNNYLKHNYQDKTYNLNTEYSLDNPLIIIVHISEIINVLLDVKSVYIYLTLKSLDNKVNIKKSSKKKTVEKFSINVSELFEFPILYSQQLFLSVDIIDSESNAYYYTCLINLNKTILKKTKFFAPTAFLLTEVHENLYSQERNEGNSNIDIFNKNNNFINYYDNIKNVYNKEMDIYNSTKYMSNTSVGLNNYFDNYYKTNQTNNFRFFNNLNDTSNFANFENANNSLMKGSNNIKEEKKNGSHNMEVSNNYSYIIMNIVLKNNEFDYEAEIIKENNINLYKELYSICNKEKIFYENKNKENEKKIEELDKTVMLLELDNENYIEINNKLKEIIDEKKEIIKIIEKIIKKKNNKIEKLLKENKKISETEKLFEENKKENNYLSQEISKLNTTFNEYKIKLKDTSQINNNLNNKINNLLFQLQNAQFKNEKLLSYLLFLLERINHFNYSNIDNPFKFFNIKKFNMNIFKYKLDNYNDLLTKLNHNMINYDKHNSINEYFNFKKCLTNEEKRNLNLEFTDYLPNSCYKKENNSDKDNTLVEYNNDCENNFSENYKYIHRNKLFDKNKNSNETINGEFLIHQYKKYITSKKNKKNNADNDSSKKEKKNVRNYLHELNMDDNKTLSNCQKYNINLNEKSDYKYGEDHSIIKEKEEKRNNIHLNDINNITLVNDEKSNFSETLSSQNIINNITNSTFSFNIKKRDKSKKKDTENKTRQEKIKDIINNNQINNCDKSYDDEFFDENSGNISYSNNDISKNNSNDIFTEMKGRYQKENLHNYKKKKNKHIYNDYSASSSDKYSSNIEQNQSTFEIDNKKDIKENINISDKNSLNVKNKENKKKLNNENYSLYIEDEKNKIKKEKKENDRKNEDNYLNFHSSEYLYDINKKNTNDYLSDYRNFEKKFNYFLKVSRNLKETILSKSDDKYSHLVNIQKKSYFNNLEKIINKCEKKEHNISFLDNYLYKKINSKFISNEEINNHKKLLRNFYLKNLKGLIFKNAFIEIYTNFYFKDNYNQKKYIRKSGHMNIFGDQNNKNIYLNIYIKSTFYNIMYIKGNINENKIDNITIIKKYLKKNDNNNKVTDDNDYIYLKKNEICLLYKLSFKSNYLNNQPLFLNIECLINDNTTIKFKISLPFVHVLFFKPSSLYLNNFIKSYSASKYYYKTYFYNMMSFSNLHEFINVLKLSNSFNIFHFKSYIILYTNYHFDDKKNSILLLLCDLSKNKNNSNGILKLHFVSISDELISFSINLFKQIL